MRRIPRLSWPHLGATGGCLLVLLVAAIAAVAAPLPGSGCAAAAVAVTRRAPALPSDSAPAVDAAQQAADEGAVSDAQSAVDQHAAAVAAAQKSLDAASALSASAQAAQDAASASPVDPTTDYAVTSAQTDVDMDHIAVETAQSSLDSAIQAEQDAKAGGYDTDSYYSSAVTTARQDLADAQAKLARDQQTLNQAQAQANASASAQATKAKDAAYLAARADAANTKALTLVEQATQVDKTLQDNLAQAKAAKAEHEAAQRAAVAAWFHRHRVRTDQVRALRAERSACRAAGIRDFGVAGGLAGTALLLGLALVFGPRSRRR